jgi:glycosyltransferase involved in cell wall biosynthesis
LLHGVASSHPDWHFVLIGDEEESVRSDWMPKLRRLSNVHHIGHRDYEELPDYLRGMSVGLLPNVINGFTTAMYPMKFHEYLAAGLPVAATPTAFTQEPHAGLEVGAGVDGFGAAIARQLARGRLTPGEAAAAVGDNTWDKRMDRMEELLAPRAAEAVR